MSIPDRWVAIRSMLNLAGETNASKAKLSTFYFRPWTRAFRVGAAAKFGSGGPIYNSQSARSDRAVEATILLVGPRGIGNNAGGVEKFAEEFMRRLPESWRATFLSLDQSPVEDIDRVECVKVPRSTICRTDKAFYLLHSLFLYATRRYDRVLILGINFGILVPIMRAMFWRRARIYVRSGSIDYLFSKWSFAAKLFIRTSEKMIRYADGVIAVAPNIKQHLMEMSINSELIPNGLQRQTRSGCTHVSRREKDILAIGRIDPVKNFRVLIAAVELLADHGVGVTIVGNADLSGEFEGLTSLLKTKPKAKVTFTGAVERHQVLEFLSEAALYINSSHYEGMPNAVLEAIQQHTPLLLSDIAAHRDLDLPDRFYFNQNSPEELATRILSALADPDIYTVSPDLFDDWDTVIAKILKFLQIASPVGGDTPHYISCGPALKK